MRSLVMISVILATFLIPSWSARRGKPWLAGAVFVLFGLLYWLAMATVVWRLPA